MYLNKIEEQNKQMVLIVYCLQLATFAIGGTALIGMIINFLSRDGAKGTWLESHHKWQLRTVLFTLLWICMAALLVIPALINSRLDILFIPAVIGILMMIIAGGWFFYKVVRGFYCFNQGRAMYSDN